MAIDLAFKVPLLLGNSNGLEKSARYLNFDFENWHLSFVLMEWRVAASRRRLELNSSQNVNNKIHNFILSSTFLYSN